MQGDRDHASHGGVSALFDEAIGDVYGYLRRRCGSADLAEELTATTFVRATVACSRGRVDQPTVAWLVTIARNLLIDHWRHQAMVERNAAVVEERPLVADPWNEVLDAARTEALLAELTPDHRAVLTLRYLDDLSVPDVADVLGRSVRATESLLARARAALRQRYDATGGAQ